MELEELKAAWIALDNRLKKNEELKESIILEMMSSKAKKSVNRFIILEMFSVVFLILCIPLFIFEFNKIGGKNWAVDITLIFVMAIGFVYPFWGIFKTQGLMKFDLSKDVGNNILCMNRYRIQLNRERKVLYYFLGPVLVILGLLSYAVWKVKFQSWTLLISVFISAGLICYWSYKWYNKNIDSVLKSLDEIRELKEE
jgi:O-antigen/teichoic acid export membrane protein